MKTLFFSLLLALSLNLWASEKHEGVCSQSTQVCALYHADAPFTSTQEAHFELFLTSPNANTATLVKADLWMQMGRHGHGSSPLKIVELAPGEYDVTRAFFVMKGSWQIRVTYLFEGTQETLIIPVMIKE
ncbi:MAG: FixH family protein [Proteobacteria bacterium]|nr:FixH family protein [Pseudomonadota bacterium]